MQFQVVYCIYSSPFYKYMELFIWVSLTFLSCCNLWQMTTRGSGISYKNTIISNNMTAFYIRYVGICMKFYLDIWLGYYACGIYYLFDGEL